MTDAEEHKTLDRADALTPGRTLGLITSAAGAVVAAGLLLVSTPSRLVQVVLLIGAAVLVATFVLLLPHDWRKRSSLVAATFVAAVGLLSELAASPAEAPTREGPIPRFVGIAGHLAESRAVLDFLDQHSHDVVYLDVGFPDLSPPGPTDGPNVEVETQSVQSGTVVRIQSVSLMTECPTGDPATDNPTTAEGCTGSSLTIQGPENDDSGTYFEHGVPVIEGYFEVDVTGGLQMGLSPITLRPLTFREASR